MNSRQNLKNVQVSGRRLFAVKRIAEALEAGLLTLNECQRAATRISPHFGKIFDGPEAVEQKAAHIVQAIETILEKQFPGRFRAGGSRGS